MFGRKKEQLQGSEPPSQTPKSGTASMTSEVMRELSKLKAENDKLKKDVDKFRVAFEHEQRKRVTMEEAIKELKETKKQLEQAQEEVFKYEIQLSDFDMQFWFFWNDLPKYAADSWLERWQKLSPPPLEERIKERDVESVNQENQH